MGWISKITDAINMAFEGVRPPVPSIPPILLLCEIEQRPGLSAISLTSNIISRLPEIGFDPGPNPDGSANMVNMFTKVMCEELIKEIQTNGVINCAMQPGAINVSGTGTAAGIAPVAITATNTSPVSIKGIMR